MKNFLLGLLVLLSLPCLAQTANDFSTYKAYQNPNFFGLNQGYYTDTAKSKGLDGISHWTSQQLSKVSADLGANTLRIPLYDYYLLQYGQNGEVADITYYKSLGYKNFTAFVGSPSSKDVLDSTFPGSPEKSKVWQGMYEPIWLNKATKTINPKNTYAQYLYNVVFTYGNDILSYEVTNEPDFTYSSGGWSGDSEPPGKDSWFYNNPSASDLYNFRANIFWYVRQLRISWEIIKTLHPEAHVCTGGIGNRSFLDAILRNTDNPQDGSITAEYPLKGGAYFDVISFHDYPQYQLRQWSNAVGGFVYQRHSDAAVQAGFLKIKGWMDSISRTYGYNDVKFPAKQFICTETAIGRVMNGDEAGGDTIARNYVIKSYIAALKNGVQQLYWYQLGDGASTYVFDRMGLYYWFAGSYPTDPIQKTPIGVAFGTMTSRLQGTSYDSVKTKSLTLPASLDGAAFLKPDGKYVYVLWAKTTKDLSEVATGSYTFPSGQNLIQYGWDYNVTQIQKTVTGTVQLSAAPTFFEESTTEQVILPITTTSLQIRNYYGTNILSWTGADEAGTYNYELQRSSDGLNFYSIYTISCTGSGSSYQRTDANPTDGANFYRLQINNWKAGHTYSNIVQYDNSRHYVNVWVFNTAGQCLLIKYTNDIPALEKTLRPGVYFLQILDHGITTTQKIIIQ